MNFFDIGFFEILVILIVILLVVGPEKLPGYARNLGKLIRNFRKITSNLTSELTKAVDLEEEATEIKKTAEDMKETVSAEADELRQALDTEAREIEESLKEGVKELSDALDKEAREIADTIKTEAKEAEVSFKKKSVKSDKVSANDMKRGKQAGQIPDENTKDGNVKKRSPTVTRRSDLDIESEENK